jgi:hypothetical protein
MSTLGRSILNQPLVVPSLREHRAATRAQASVGNDARLLRSSKVLVQSFNDCPLVTHEGGKSCTVGRGWDAYTIIQGGGSPPGIMFNDTAISRASFDESKQAQAARRR